MTSLSDGDIRLEPLTAAARGGDGRARAGSGRRPLHARARPGARTASARAGSSATRAGARSGRTRASRSSTPTTGDFLGFMALVKLDLETQEAEAGYIVASHARGRGVATRALRLLTAWAFDELPLERIELLIDVENLAVGGRRAALRLHARRRAALDVPQAGPALGHDRLLEAAARALLGRNGPDPSPGLGTRLVGTSGRRAVIALSAPRSSRRRQTGHDPSPGLGSRLVGTPGGAWSSTLRALSSSRALASQERRRVDSRAPGGARTERARHVDRPRAVRGRGGDRHRRRRHSRLGRADRRSSSARTSSTTRATSARRDARPRPSTCRSRTPRAG